MNHAKKNPIRTAARAQAGMTLLEIMIVLAIIAVVMGFLVGPRVLNMFSDSKTKTTKLIVKDIANTAWGSWTVATGETCPKSLKDLEKYRNSKEIKDSWGSEFVMLCGENAPEGVQFGVFSKGPDKKENTDDDIKSWE